MISDLRQGARLLPTVVRRPALAARWLAGAHRAQFVLVLTGALALFSLPPLLDWLLPRIYPPVKSQWSVLGIPALSSRRPDPRVATRKEQTMVAVWVLWLGAAFALMLVELPRAAAKSGVGGAKAAGTDATVVDTPADHGAARPSLPEAPKTPAPGESGVGHMGLSDRYRLTRELGSGGMGVVYHAVDTVLQREVALKELPVHLGAKSELAERFRQEARVLAKLSHPSVVQVHDLIENEGRLWIALEYVRGGSLGDSMKLRGGSLPWAEAARLGRQIAEGLAFAHEQGVVHRDIKPLNVLLTDGKPPMAKLTDFGLAKLAESTEHTQPGSVLGSARYMSPEQAQGRTADARSDLYALGITFYEMLTGAVPFEGEFAVVLARHLNEVPPDVRELAPEVPEGFAALVAALLQKDPARRPADARHVAFALGEIASHDDRLDRAA